MALDKNQIIISKIIHNIVDDNLEVKSIMIGGESLNQLTSFYRESQDIDFALKTIDDKEATRSKLKKVFKRIRSNIEAEFNIDILRANNKLEGKKFRDENRSFYEPYPFVYKLNIYIKEKYYKFEISTDETIPFFETTKIMHGIESISLESILAIKMVIVAKRMIDNTMLNEKNIRHLFDIWRSIYTLENINKIKVLEYISILIKYESKRKGTKVSFNNNQEIFETMINSLNSDDFMEEYIYLFESRYHPIKIDLSKMRSAIIELITSLTNALIVDYAVDKS